MVKTHISETGPASIMKQVYLLS